MGNLINSTAGLLEKGATEEQITKLALLDARLVFAPDWEDTPWYVWVGGVDYWWKEENSIKFIHFSSAQEAVDAYVAHKTRR